MTHFSREQAGPVPTTDLITFSFDKQNDYDEDAPLLIDADEPSKFLSARSQKTLIRRLIAGFRHFGLQPGDAVLCNIPNSYFYPSVFFSIVGTGAAWCGSNPANQVFELEHFVELAEPRFIVTGPETLPAVLEACEKRQFPKDRVFVLDTTTFPLYFGVPSAFWGCDDSKSTNDGTRSFSELLCYGEEDWVSFDDEYLAKTTPAVYFSTSGTTGLPKLAMVSHHSLIVHHLALHEDMPFQVKRLISLPFFHLFATMLCFIQPMRYFEQTFVMKRFNPEKWLTNVEKFQITELYGAPPMIVAAINSPLDVINLLKTVKYMGVGGAPIDAVTINKMRTLLQPGATMTCMWGMTEIGVTTLFRHGENDETGSVGRFMRGYEGRLIDSDGRLVNTDGEPGELFVRTEGTMLGYRGMPLSEEDKLWFRTGDVCCFKEGKLYVVGRAKELIKVKGWQVAPAELEAVICQHPEVVDAAVVGTLSADGVNEVPRAYVVRQKKMYGRDCVTAEEIFNFTKGRLASYKALHGGVCFVESIPRTPSGKIQRRKLSQMDEIRQSITNVMLDAAVVDPLKEKVTEIKYSAMAEVESPASPTIQSRILRRSVRLLSLGSRSRSSTSAGSSDSLPTMGKFRVLPRRKVSSDSTVSKASKASAQTKAKKNGRSKNGKIKRLIKAVQAAAAA